MKIAKFLLTTSLTLFITISAYAQADTKSTPSIKDNKVTEGLENKPEIKIIQLTPESNINLLNISQEEFDAIAFNLIKESANCRVTLALSQYLAITSAGFLRMAGAAPTIWRPAINMSISAKARFDTILSFLKDLKNVSDKRGDDISDYFKQGNEVFAKNLPAALRFQMRSANSPLGSQQFWVSLYTSKKACNGLSLTMNRLLKINLASDSIVTPELE